MEMLIGDTPTASILLKNQGGGRVVQDKLLTCVNIGDCSILWFWKYISKAEFQEKHPLLCQGPPSKAFPLHNISRTTL